GGGGLPVEAGEVVEGLGEIVGGGRLVDAGGGAVGLVQVLRADVLDELLAVHAVVEQELADAALRDPVAREGGAVAGRRDQIERVGLALHRPGRLRLVARLFPYTALSKLSAARAGCILAGAP